MERLNFFVGHTALRPFVLLEVIYVYFLTSLRKYWDILDLNQGPKDYESSALTAELISRPSTRKCIYYIRNSAFGSIMKEELYSYFLKTVYSSSISLFSASTSIKGLSVPFMQEADSSLYSGKASAIFLISMAAIFE